MVLRSPLMVTYVTFIVSNIVSLTVFEILMQKFCDLDLGRFKIVQG